MTYTQMSIQQNIHSIMSTWTYVLYMYIHTYFLRMCRFGLKYVWVCIRLLHERIQSARWTIHEIRSTLFSVLTYRWCPAFCITIPIYLIVSTLFWVKYFSDRHSIQCIIEYCQMHCTIPSAKHLQNKCKGLVINFLVYSFS